MRIQYQALLELLSVLVGSTLTVVLTHDVPYLLSTPYWLDEAWVAVSARLPLSDVLSISSSTPPGWNILQQTLAPFGDQAQRMLPLAFIVGSGVVAYYAARAFVSEKSPFPRMTGIIAAIGVMLIPATLDRNDLKQYTCDGFVALAIVLAACVAARRGWSVRSLWLVTTVSIVGFALSITSVFVALTVVVVVAGYATTTRKWNLIRRSVLPILVLGAGLVILYLVLYARANNSELNSYWDFYYPTVQELPQFLIGRARALGPLLLFGRWWITVGLVLTASIISIARWRSPIGVFPIALGIVMVFAGVAHRYPLLDTRTSHFLLVTLTFFACIGLGVGLTLLGTALIRGSSVLRTALIATAAAAVIALIAVSAVPDANAHSIPGEDARAQIDYVARHEKPNDVILVNQFGGYAMGYYWSKNQPGWIHDSAFATAFQIHYSSASGIIVATSDSPDWISKATTLAEKRGGNLWIIRTHVAPAVRTTWNAHLKQARSISVGSEPLEFVALDDSHAQ